MMITSGDVNHSVLVLVIDEAREVSRLLSGFLRRRGIEVQAATTPREALERIRERRPDVVLLDVSPTNHDGLELLSVLRGPDHDLPVIAMAKAADCEEAQASLELGARDFMAKPLDLAYLETSLWAQLTNAGASEGQGQGTC